MLILLFFANIIDMISVIIPVYNVEKYLSECLDSIINQTFRDLEIICINDGSTDNSISILNIYAKKDNRIIVIDKKNSGVSSARNDGISLSRGEYLFFIDSDDYIDLDFLEKFYKNAKDNNSDLVVLSSFWSLDKRVSNNFHSALPTCSMFIKTDILRENNNIRYPINIQPGEDGIFSHMLLMYTKKVSFEYDTHYHYRKRLGQDSQRALKEPKILVDAIRKWIDILDKFYIENDLYIKKSLSFAKYIEQEIFLAFRTKNFTVDDETIIFSNTKEILNKISNYLNKEDYNNFSKEFIFFLDANTIKEYYQKVKYRYNYIRIRLLSKDISIRYKENRLKYYK